MNQPHPAQEFRQPLGGFSLTGPTRSSDESTMPSSLTTISEGSTPALCWASTPRPRLGDFGYEGIDL